MEYEHFPIFFQNVRYAKSALKQCGVIEQKYSHFTLQADVFSAESKASGAGWFSQEILETLPLSEADKKIVALYVACLHHL